MGHSRGHNVRLLTLAALWTASGLFMVFGTHYDSMARLAWGVWLAMGATVLTVQWVVEAAVHRHQVRVENLARIMAIEARRLHGGGDEGDNVVSMR